MKRALRGLLCSVLPAETSCHAASPTQPGVVVVRPGCTCGISTQHTHHSLLFIPLFIITVCALVLHEHGALRPPAPCMTSPNTRYFTNKPEHTVYSGPTAQSPSRITLRTIAEKHKRGERISMVTAYDYPSAVHVDRAGIDMLLVGDSVGMVVHGHDTTLPVTLDDMLLHCKAVSRGAQRAFVVADLPFGTYEADTRDAVHAAVRLLKEGHVDAVKMEGGGPSRVRSAAALVDAGIAVMGHCGLLPQSISALGGFRPQGQHAHSALQVLQQAKALEAAGCMGVVLECVPPAVGALVTAELTIPTIGIGAGPHTSGQVLVYHDLLGMMTHPHYTAVTPKFCKRFAHIGAAINEALQEYDAEVKGGGFPGPAHSPYKMDGQQVDLLKQLLKEQGYDKGLAATEQVLTGG